MLRHLVLLFVCVIAAQATVVNFDDLSGEAQIADGYGGINWGGEWTHYDPIQPPYYPKSGTQRAYPTNNAVAAEFTFVTPDRMFQGAWFSGYDTISVAFELFNDGNLVHTSSSLIPTATPAFLASGYSGAIDTVRVLSAQNLWVMDDVTYDAAIVPEPGTISLIGAGLVGLFIVRRRRE